MRIKNIFVLLLSCTLLLSCNHSTLDVDISSIKIDTKSINLDSIIYYSPETEITTWNQQLKKEISELYDYQIGYCLRIGMVSDTAFHNAIMQFRSDKFMQRVEKRIHEKFSSLSMHNDKIIEALKYLKYHFPKGKTPSNIVFFNSIFNSNTWSSDAEIGIGLERYLGNNTDVIKELPNQSFFPWIKERMKIEYLERDALTSWIMTHYVPETEKDLADIIVRWGKIIYLTEASFPNAPKNIIMRYSEKEYQYALDNEYNFWKYLCDEKLLFKYNETNVANMIKDGPFTAGLPDKAPDRFGQFIGWRMVQKYMEKTDCTLEKLIDTPYQNILQEYEIED